MRTALLTLTAGAVLLAAAALAAGVALAYADDFQSRIGL